MRLEYPYRVLPEAFPEDFCQKIIAAGLAAENMDGSVFHDPSNKLRDSTVAWFGDKPKHAWMFEPMRKVLDDANEECWRWKIESSEPMQFTTYGIGQHYGWHTDQKKKPFPPESKWPGMMRKLTMVVSLADGDDYKGGDFVLDTTETPPTMMEKRLKTITGVRKMGAAIIFPSYLFHRVTEVASGTRRSLVAWFLGPPYV